MLVIRSQAKVYLNTFLPNITKKKQAKKQTAHKETAEKRQKKQTNEKNQLGFIAYRVLTRSCSYCNNVTSTHVNRIPWKYRKSESDNEGRCTTSCSSERSISGFFELSTKASDDVCAFIARQYNCNYSHIFFYVDHFSAMEILSAELIT